ncbi:MAG TPA: DUF3501 family protein [Methylomirabilota bacterium]|nr:DUF3501 family protein [Methylomirabilota bacterium]
MTRPVLRPDLLDARSYEGQRPALREEVFVVKARRRIHVGEFFTFLFENTVTIRYQIQEMLRAEHITDEAAIQHELDTYNALLGGVGELGCTLLIEIDDPTLRAVRLREWFGLPEHVYVRLPDGTKVSATFDPSQRGEGRLSSVQYLKFRVGRAVPVAVGIDLPGLTTETPLTPEQRAALTEDLQ